MTATPHVDQARLFRENESLRTERASLMRQLELAAKRADDAREVARAYHAETEAEMQRLRARVAALEAAPDPAPYRAQIIDSQVEEIAALHERVAQLQSALEHAHGLVNMIPFFRDDDHQDQLAEQAELALVNDETERDTERGEAMQWRDIDTLDAIDRAAQAELADLAAPTEWGTAGVEWNWGSCSTDGPGVITGPGGSEVEMRGHVAQMETRPGWRKALLRREHTAWHEIEEDA